MNFVQFVPTLQTYIMAYQTSFFVNLGAIRKVVMSIL